MDEKTQQSLFLRKVINAIRVRHYSRRTESFRLFIEFVRK